MTWEVWTTEPEPRIAHGAIRSYDEAERLAAHLRQVCAQGGLGYGATVRRARRPFTFRTPTKGRY